MSEYIQTLTCVDSKQKAEEIAKILLEQRAASSVQILGPISSRYWWKGNIKKAQEWMCIIKGKATDYQRIESLIKKVHPYEVPGILATPISNGSREYLDWIQKETTPRGASSRDITG